MNSRSHRLTLCTLSVVAAVAAGDAAAFPNPFRKKEPQAAPAAAEMRSAEASAGDLLKRAQDDEGAGRTSSAMSLYKKVVQDYPLTSFAPVAKFRMAAVWEADGKYSKAFDGYQELVETYKQSTQFAEALDRQYEIATKARTEKLGSFLGISKKLDTSRVLEMFQKVIANAPRGPHAAESQMEIARIHEEEQETDLSILAYKKVVDEYPGSPLAAEAQSRISKGYIGKVEDGSRDNSNIELARDATDTAMGLFPEAGMVPDLASTREQIDEAAAETAWKTGRFYEKAGNYKAALIYYSDVLRSPGSEHFAEARERINEMTARDPKLIESVPAVAVTSKDLAVPAARDVKTMSGYFGPPPPASRVAASVQKPRMRSDDMIPITPIDEPDLPTGTRPESGTPAAPDNTLLDPGLMADPETLEPGVLKPGDAMPADTVLPDEPIPPLPSLDPLPAPPTAPAPEVTPDPAPAPEPAPEMEEKPASN